MRLVIAVLLWIMLGLPWGPKSYYDDPWMPGVEQDELPDYSDIVPRGGP